MNCLHGIPTYKCASRTGYSQTCPQSQGNLRRRDASQILSAHHRRRAQPAVKLRWPLRCTVCQQPADTQPGGRPGAIAATLTERSTHSLRPKWLNPHNFMTSYPIPPQNDLPMNTMSHDLNHVQGFHAIIGNFTGMLIKPSRTHC